MSTTKKIPREELTRYFDDFSRRFLMDGAIEAADVEILHPDLGDQFETEGAHLLGITYDHPKNSLEFALESGDHRVYEPQEVWVVEEPDHFVSSVEVVAPDGHREVVTVKKVGIRRLRRQ